MNFNRLLTLALLALLLVALLTGCGLTPETKSAVESGIAINAGHEKDTGLPPSAHAIAQDNRDLLWSILLNEGAVGAEEVPADVLARYEARKKAKAGGDK